MGFERLAVDFQVTPSTPFLEVHLYEVESEDKYSYAEFIAWENDNTYSRMRMIFEGLVSGKLTPFGEETADSNISIGMVTDSLWITEYIKNHNKYYGDSSEVSKTLKHIFLKGHDAVIEVLCRGYSFSKVVDLTNW